MARPRQRLHRRAAAWVATGPVGHLYAGVADWAQLVAQLVRRRLRRGARGRRAARARSQPGSVGAARQAGMARRR